MKKIVIALILIPFFGFTQTIKNLDFIAPMSDDLIAVQKNNTWGFINNEGTLVIDFRDDLVLTPSAQGEYPVFKNGRCLISEKKDGITYFGYIDKTGETIIEPQFLNATNFENNKALVLHVIEERIGKNEILGKNVVFHRCFEVLIDHNGEIKNYLNPEGVNIVLSKTRLRTPPNITSKKITDNIYAVLNKNKKWTVEVIDK